MKPALLDNFGLTISVGQLTSTAAYRYISRRYRGTNPLSRVYCRWVRPALLKRQQAEIESAWRSIEAVRREQFLQLSSQWERRFTGR